MTWEDDIFNGIGFMVVQEPDSGIVSTGITAPTVKTTITTPLTQQIKLPAPVIPITPIAAPMQQIIPTPLIDPTTNVLPNNNCTDCGGDTIQQIAPGEPTPGSFDLMDWAKKNWWLLLIGAGATYLIMKDNKKNHG